MSRLYTAARAAVAAGLLVSAAGHMRAASAEIVAAVLPASRSVQVGTPATAFATIINTSQITATGCRLTNPPTVPASFTFQSTDPATNRPVGGPNSPVDIPPGAARTFVFALTPTMPIAPTEAAIGFVCANTSPAPSTPGLNTLLISAEADPIPDIVALAAVPTGDGIVTLASSTDTGVLAVASVNVGAGAQITATADTRGTALPLDLRLCRTNSNTGACLEPPAAAVIAPIDRDGTATFSVFVAGTGPVAFDPANHRVAIRFTDARGIVRGATTVAVRTLPGVALTAVPSSVQVNGTTTVSWAVSNATGCTASGDWSGPRSASGGSETINVGSSVGSRTYTLSCTGPGGAKSASAVVSVRSAGPPPNCSLVSSGDRLLNIVNNLSTGLEVFLPQFAFEDDIRPGPGVCDSIGLTVGGGALTVQVELTQCVNSAENSDCTSTFGPTRRLDILLRNGDSQTITVDSSIFR